MMQARSKEERKIRQKWLDDIIQTVLILAYICVNLAALAIHPDMGALVTISNTFMVYQFGLLDKVLAGLVYAAVCVFFFMAWKDAVYIMAVHSLFYLACIMKTLADKILTKAIA